MKIIPFGPYISALVFGGKKWQTNSTAIYKARAHEALQSATMGKAGRLVALPAGS
ncbi:MAG TPA: hypothetical protein VFC78_00095 [Tepidisphaeraceae bacterium]|nr:hypothetical protein [Tepidisphaeraceae bacterium]